MMVIKISVLELCSLVDWGDTITASSPPTSFSVFICGNFNKVNFLVPHHLSFGS